MNQARLFRLWFFIVLILAGSLPGAPLKNAVHAAGGKSIAQDNIVISEFRLQGPNGLEDDFVEIFNPTAGTIDIGGWLIRVIDNTGGIATRYTFPAGQALLAGQHYLVAGSSSSGGVPADGSLAPGGLPVDGGIVITLADETIVDKVGMSILAAEGTPLTLLTNPDQSYERKPGGVLGSCYDSNNNAFDFIAINQADPQNLDSSFTVCAAPTDTPTPSPSNTSNSPGTPTNTETGTPTFTPTASPSTTNTPTPSQIGTVSVTPTATPSAPLHIVISEFRTQGSYGAEDEFVELYNPTGAAVNIGGWTIKGSSSCGTSTFTLVSIPGGTILLAGQHYLAATTAAHLPAPDQIFSPGIADDGGLALINSSGIVIDQVGLCITTIYREGSNLVPLSGNLNQSYERRPGGSTSCYDLDNNFADFVLISPSTPQNKASPPVMCRGVAVYTPTRTPTSTRTRTPFPTATSLPGTVVINEFLPHPHTDWNGDGLANTSDEFIELINMGTLSINLKNWRLDNGIGGSSTPFSLPDVTLLPRQIINFYHFDSGIGLSDGGSTVRLLKPNGQTGDIFTYPYVDAIDKSWCRLPDGTGPWAFACYPTPGKLNQPFGSEPNPLAIKTGTDLFCLEHTAPQAVLSAECDSFGTKLWEQIMIREFWLDSRGKWAVFVQ